MFSDVHEKQYPIYYAALLSSQDSYMLQKLPIFPKLDKKHNLSITLKSN